MSNKVKQVDLYKQKIKRKTMDFKDYKGNTIEGQGYADVRKRKAVYNYMKMKKKDRDMDKHSTKLTDDRSHSKAKHKSSESFNGKNKTWTSFKQNKKTESGLFKLAAKKREEKSRKKEAAEKKKEEKAKAIKEYKTRKQERHLKLCKRTSKGQPVMSGQMEVLLAKIQKQKNK